MIPEPEWKEKIQGDVLAIRFSCWVALEDHDEPAEVYAIYLAPRAMQVCIRFRAREPCHVTGWVLRDDHDLFYGDARGQFDKRLKAGEETTFSWRNVMTIIGEEIK